MLFLRVIWLPGAVLVATLFWIWLDFHMGWKGPQAIWPGIVLIVLGQGLALWCAALFLLRGRGSPHPFVVKTQNLVIVGPFKVVRNPMMWGVAATLVGLCLLLGSASLWIGFGCFLLVVYWFVRLYEEPDLERRFGEAYRAYCRQVPRWLPRPRARRAAKSAGAGGH